MPHQRQKPVSFCFCFNLMCPSRHFWLCSEGLLWSHVPPHPTPHVLELPAFVPTLSSLWVSLSFGQTPRPAGGCHAGSWADRGTAELSPALQPGEGGDRQVSPFPPPDTLPPREEHVEGFVGGVGAIRSAWEQSGELSCIPPLSPLALLPQPGLSARHFPIHWLQGIPPVPGHRGQVPGGGEQPASGRRCVEGRGAA